MHTTATLLLRILFHASFIKLMEGRLIASMFSVSAPSTAKASAGIVPLTS